MLSGLEEDTAGAGRQIGFRTGMRRQDWSTAALHQGEIWDGWVPGVEREEARPGQARAPRGPLQEGYAGLRRPCRGETFSTGDASPI